MITSAYFDIDGTLLSERTGNLIPESAKRALIELRRRGVKLFICSGRTRAQLPPCIKDGFPGFEDGFDGYITMTGSLCYDHDGVYSNTPIRPELVRRFVDLTERTGMEALALLSESIYANHRGEKIRELERKVAFTYPERDFRELVGGSAVPDTADVGGASDALGAACAAGEACAGDANPAVEPVYQFCAFVPPEGEGPVREATGDCIITRWTDLFCDVVPAGSSKPAGVKATLAHFGLDREGTIAFGDGGNDATMLRYCQIGVAMGNGGDDAKAAADYVTDNVDKDGIAKALRHFGLID